MMKCCTKCKVERPLEHFYKNGIYTDGSVRRRPDCKFCQRESKRIPESEKLYASDPIDYIFRLCKRLAHDARSRVSAPSRQHKKSYRDLAEPFGFNSARDMYLYLYSEFKDDISKLLAAGKRPSVDRIDSSKGYTPGNIRIIDHGENTLLGVQKRKRQVSVVTPEGDAMVFESVTACARAYGTNDGHVRGWINGKWRPKNGCNFHYANCD